MHNQFVEPAKRFADVIIPTGLDPRRSRRPAPLHMAPTSGQGRAALRALDSPSLLPKGRSSLRPCRLRTAPRACRLRRAKATRDHDEAWRLASLAAGRIRFSVTGK